MCESVQQKLGHTISGPLVIRTKQKKVLLSLAINLGAILTKNLKLM
jgi:hypothetical protein